MKSNIASKKTRKIPWRLIINSAVAVMLCYLVYSQWPQLMASGGKLINTNYWLAGLGLGLIMITYPLAAMQYKNLALHHLKFGATSLVQLAGALVNRILPAGIGGISLNIDYLKRRGHSLADASIIATTNNLLGIVMHILILASVLTLSDRNLILSLPKFVYLLLIGVACILFILLLTASTVSRFKRLLHQAAKPIKLMAGEFRRRPLRLMLAALAALLVSIGFITSLMVCAWALGYNDFNFEQATLVMTVGVLSATATPTPGGVVGAEAGLAAALIGFGFNSSGAIATALLYRIVSYWIPLAFGSIAYVVAQHKKYV